MKMISRWMNIQYRYNQEYEVRQSDWSCIQSWCNIDWNVSEPYIVFNIWSGQQFDCLLQTISMSSWISPAEPCSLVLCVFVMIYKNICKSNMYSYILNCMYNLNMTNYYYYYYYYFINHINMLKYFNFKLFLGSSD